MTGPPENSDTPAAALATDETLVDALLALSPEERLRLNDRMAQAIEELRHGFAAAEPHHPPGTPGGDRR
jgi:hypothetical protein